MATVASNQRPLGVILRFDGAVVEYHSSLWNVAVNQEAEPLDPTSICGGGPLDYVAGELTVKVELRNAGPPPAPKTLAESMALEVLRGDEASARALADLLVEDVARAASGRPTHAELERRAKQDEADLRALASLIGRGHCPECGVYLRGGVGHQYDCEFRDLLGRLGERFPAP